MWLLLSCGIRVCDYFRVDVPEEEGQMSYWEALLFRMIGNYAGGRLYILALAMEPFVRDNVERFTCLFLVAQGFAVLACGKLVSTTSLQ